MAYEPSDRTPVALDIRIAQPLWSMSDSSGDRFPPQHRFAPLGALIALTLTALCLRVVVLLATARLSADEAVPGLMARHILTMGELPVFYWGQAYFGALESYLIATLFWVFGFQWWLVFVPALLASVALVPLTWALAARLGPWPAALLAALPIALPTPVFSRLLGNAGGGFALAVALQLAALVCLLPALTNRAPVRGVRLGLASLLVGLAGWVWQPALVALLPLLLVVLAVHAHDGARRLLPQVALVAVGLAPLLVYNVALGWPTALTIGAKLSELPAGEPGLLERLARVAWMLHTAFGGGEETLGGANAGQALLVAVAFVLQPALIVFIAVRRPSAVWRARATATLVVVAVAALSTLAVHTGARHLVLPALIGYALCGALLALVASRTRAARVLVLGLAVAVFGLGNLRAYADIDSALQAERLSHLRDTGQALAALDERGLRRGYADYWTAYPLTFMSGERIVLAPTLPDAWGPGVDRYPAYTAEVAVTTDAEQLFLLLDRHCPLDPSAARHRVEEVGRWWLVWGFQTVPDASKLAAATRC